MKALLRGFFLFNVVRFVLLAVKLANDGNLILFRNLVHLDDSFEGVGNLEIYESK